METVLITLTAILFIGIASQWLAWRLRLPSILLLLISGFVAGRFFDPDEQFGELLMPVVSLSVAIILFEGGLSLRLGELREVGKVVRNFVTVGIAVTWVIASGAAYWCLGFGGREALLIGAILVVTGPTVVGPLLRQIRPHGETNSILKWEGILNDAIGAALAVLVFKAILAESSTGASILVLFGVIKTLAIGVFTGLAAAFLLTRLLHRNWIPDHLHNPATVAIVLAAFTLSNEMQEESGLLTVTIMGVAVASQKLVAVRHLIEFKENLRVLLLSVLFIVLAARVELDQIINLGAGSIVFVAVLIFVARPAAVFLCTWGSGLTWKEKLFLTLMRHVESLRPQSPRSSPFVWPKRDFPMLNLSHPSSSSSSPSPLLSTDSWPGALHESSGSPIRTPRAW